MRVARLRVCRTVRKKSGSLLIHCSHRTSLRVRASARRLHGPWQCVLLDLVRDSSVHAGFNGGSGILVLDPAVDGGSYVGNRISNGIGMPTRN